jgi:hypothetical protein
MQDRSRADRRFPGVALVYMSGTPATELLVFKDWNDRCSTLQAGIVPAGARA